MAKILNFFKRSGKKTKSEEYLRSLNEIHAAIENSIRVQEEANRFLLEELDIARAADTEKLKQVICDCFKQQQPADLVKQVLSVLLADDSVREMIRDTLSQELKSLECEPSPAEVPVAAAPAKAVIDPVQAAAQLIEQVVSEYKAAVKTHERAAFQRKYNAMPYGIKDAELAKMLSTYATSEYVVNAESPSMILVKLKNGDGIVLLQQKAAERSQQGKFESDGLPTFFNVGWSEEYPVLITPAIVKLDGESVVDVIKKGELT